jgi:hypothetical protein
VENALTTPRQKLLPLLCRQTEVVGNTVLHIRDPFLTFGSEAKDRQHQRLIVWDRHSQLLASGGYLGRKYRR